MIFGKTNSMKKVAIMGLLCFATMQTFGQAKDANSIYAQAEEQFTAKNYNDALSKLALYENLSSASKEKAQVLKIQIYRELALKDTSKANDYNNAVKELKSMFASGKKVNAEDLHRILKEQQEFNTDAASQSKDGLSSASSEVSIDGIKIGMNVEEIPSQVSANFDWSKGMKMQANNQTNYVPLMFSSKTGITGGAFNIKISGIQNITLDDRTRRVIDVYKILENGKYKEKEKTGLSGYNALVNELKTKYGESNVTVSAPQVTTIKVMNKEIRTEAYNAAIHSKSVSYTLSYAIANNSYSIIERLMISDYIKN